MCPCKSQTLSSVLSTHFKMCGFKEIDQLTKRLSCRHEGLSSESQHQIKGVSVIPGLGGKPGVHWPAPLMNWCAPDSVEDSERKVKRDRGAHLHSASDQHTRMCTHTRTFTHRNVNTHISMYVHYVNSLKNMQIIIQRKRALTSWRCHLPHTPDVCPQHERWRFDFII